MRMRLFMQYLIMIEFNEVTQRYPSGNEALNRITFSLQAGEMAFLTGHSGAGKSTLLKLIALLERPVSGQILVNGCRLNSLKKQQIAHFRSTLGIVFQTPHLLQDHTIFENVAMPLRLQGVSNVQLTKRVFASLDKVGLLRQAKRLPRQLSTGEQQRVGIARAIVHKPVLLLADEPTGNLDPCLSMEVMRLFEQFNQAGVTVLIATHALQLIASMKHAIMVLKGGKLC